MITDFRELLAEFVDYGVRLLTSISGVGFAEAWAGRMSGNLFGVAVALIGREAFRKNTLGSGRPRDLEDIRSLGE